jgi:Cys-rich four helix bundle protein (predicted Tat secretion target)
MDVGMKRREVLTGIGAMVMAVGPDAAFAAETHADHMAAPSPAVKALIDAAFACEETGEACIAHCLAMFRAGDTSLAPCATSVQQMLPACSAVSRLANYGSPHLAAMAAVCAKICADCEAECRKHEQHPPCKACADACAKFVAAAKALAA